MIHNKAQLASHLNDRNVFVKFSGLLVSSYTALWCTHFSVALSRAALIVLYKHRIDTYSFERNRIACTDSVTQKKDVVRVLRPLSVCVGQTVVEIRIPQHPFQQGHEIFSSPQIIRPALGATNPPLQWVPWLFPPGGKLAGA